MKKTPFSIAMIASSTLLLSAAPALALENGEPVPANTESGSVVALRIGKVSNFSDCTDTLATDQWVFIARRRPGSVNNEGTQICIGGKVYNVDPWTLSPMFDVGLLHLTEKVTDVASMKASRDIPAPGRMGTLYGWGSSSSMARSGQFPMTKMVANELLGGGPTEGAPGEVVSGATQTELIPAGTKGIPADAAMMLMIQSAILGAHSVSGAGMQGDDSGDPFSVDGGPVGLATAGAPNSDPGLLSPSTAITTSASTANWVDDITPGRDTESVPIAENTSALSETVRTSGDRTWACLVIVCVGVIIAAAGSHIRNG